MISWTFASFLCAFQTVASLRLVTITSGVLPDIGTPPLVSTMQVALDLFEKKYPAVCTNYTLHWEGLDSGDTMCDDQPETENFQNVLARLYSEHLLDNDGPTVVISTACPKVFASIANYAKETDVLAVTFVESDEMFKDKTKFPTALSATLAKMSDYGVMLVKVMDRFNWKSIAVIKDALSVWHGVAAGRKYYVICVAILDALRARDDILVAEVNVDSADAGWAQKALLEASDHSRIVMSCTMDVHHRELAIAAHDLKMTGGDYVLMHLTTTDASFEHDLACCKNDGLDEKAKDGFASYMLLRSAPVNWRGLHNFTSAIRDTWLQKFGKPPTPWPYEGIERAEFMLSATEGLQSIIEVKQTAKEAPFHLNQTQTSHDKSLDIHPKTDWCLADEFFLRDYRSAPKSMAVANKLAQNPNYQFSGKTLAASMWNQTYDTISRPITYDEVGMRVSLGELQQFDLATLEFRTIAKINSSALVLENLKGKTFTWKNGAPPPDTPACGLRNERCVQSNILPPAAGAAAAVVVLAFVFGCFARSRIVHNFMEWVISPDAVEIPDHTPFDRKDATTAERVRLIKDTLVVVTTPASNKVNPALLGKTNNKAKTKLGTLLFQISHLRHENVDRLVGISLVPPSLFYVCCERGCLLDLEDSIRTDWTMKTSFLQDMVEGVYDIHHSPLHYHGNLKPEKCLFTPRIELKIGDLGKERLLTVLTGIPIVPSLTEYSAPETSQGKWSAPSDVYSMCVIADKIFDITEAIPKFAFVRNNQSYPDKQAIILSKLQELNEHGRALNPGDRPTIVAYRKKLTTILGKKLAVMDSLMRRLEKHASDLEDLVFIRQGELLLEQRKCDDLLSEMLPGTVVKTLRMGGTVAPETFDSVTMYVSYVAGFGGFVAQKTAFDVVNFLHDLYSRSDNVTSKSDVYKLETINDSQLLVSGLPNKNGMNHVREICNMALRLLMDFEAIGMAGMDLQVGLHSGPVVAAVAGQKRPRYCLFGDTINTASRMASNGQPGKIHLSPQCADLASTFGLWIELRGEMEIKGKGVIRTYWLLNDLPKPSEKGLSREPPSEFEPH